MIVCESVYSMEGTVAPLAAYAELAVRHGALLYCDEVHGAGVWGRHGEGVLGALGLLDDPALDAHLLVQGNLGKAFGLLGGYLAGPGDLVDLIRLAAPGLIFTTALPPALACAGLVALQPAARRPRGPRPRSGTLWRAPAPPSRTHRIPLLPSRSHILPVYVGREADARWLSRRLLEDHGINIAGVWWPTVPRGHARLRISPSPAHKKAPHRPPRPRPSPRSGHNARPSQDPSRPSSRASPRGLTTSRPRSWPAGRAGRR